MNDGRVVSNFILQALHGKPITVRHTDCMVRWFRTLLDLWRGEPNSLVPVRFRSRGRHDRPHEQQYDASGQYWKPRRAHHQRLCHDHTRSRWCVSTITVPIVPWTILGSGSQIVNLAKQEDDPQQRRPDIRRAAEILGWRPQVAISHGYCFKHNCLKVTMRDGLKKTIEYFRDELQNERQRFEQDDNVN